MGLRKIGFSLTPQDAPALQAGLLCQAWENWQPKEDLFRVSETSCFLLSPGKETDGALPAYERYVCGYFNRGVHKMLLFCGYWWTLQLGFPEKYITCVPLKLVALRKKTLTPLEKVPLCIKSHKCFLCTDRTARGVGLQHLASSTKHNHFKML